MSGAVKTNYTTNNYIKKLHYNCYFTVITIILDIAVVLFNDCHKERVLLCIILFSLYVTIIYILMEIITFRVSHKIILKIINEE